MSERGKGFTQQQAQEIKRLVERSEITPANVLCEIVPNLILNRLPTHTRETLRLVRIPKIAQEITNLMDLEITEAHFFRYAFQLRLTKLKHFEWRRRNSIHYTLRNPDSVRDDPKLIESYQQKEQLLNSAIELFGEQSSLVRINESPDKVSESNVSVHNWLGQSVASGYLLAVHFNEQTSEPQHLAYLMQREREKILAAGTHVPEGSRRLINKSFMITSTFHLD